MDHTHGRDLTPNIATIDRIKDERLYGIFPGFVDLICQIDVQNAIDDLNQLDVDAVRTFVERIPSEWRVEPNARTALVNLITQRASFTVDTLLTRVANICWPDKLFDNQ